MKIIFKYELDLITEQRICMPMAAQLLDVQVQSGKIMLWALVNPKNPKDERCIRIYETGNSITDMSIHEFHIATLQLGGSVWHVFDRMFQ